MPVLGYRGHNFKSCALARPLPRARPPARGHDLEGIKVEVACSLRLRGVFGRRVPRGAPDPCRLRPRKRGRALVVRGCVSSDSLFGRGVRHRIEINDCCGRRIPLERRPCGEHRGGICSGGLLGGRRWDRRDHGGRVNPCSRHCGGHRNRFCHNIILGDR